jgi:hypothetical protein
MGQDSSNDSRRRSRWAVRGIFAAVLAALLGYIRCGAQLGVGGGAGAPSQPSQPGAERVTAPAPPDAPVARCQLRLDGGGLWLLGPTGQAPTEVAAAVAACTAAGGADVVLTGEARQGAWDELRAALDAAAVPSFVRGAAGAAGAPPSRSAAPDGAGASGSGASGNDGAASGR